MGLVVTALSQTGEVSALKAALSAASLPLEPLRVIAAEVPAVNLARGLAGADLMTSDSGTSVPGINSRERNLPFFRSESLPDRLGDLEIPESELDNYAEAVQRGKSVVAYFGKPETVERVVGAFRSDASLTNVRQF